MALGAPVWAHLRLRRVYAPAIALALGVCLGTGAWWHFHDRTHDRVYRMGFQHMPPAQYVDAHGGPAGAIVEGINDAARLAGIRLQWVRVQEGPEFAFRQKKVDLWPLIGKSSDREKFIHFSDPYLRLTYWILTLENNPLPKNWAGLKVAHGVGTVPPKWEGRLTPGAQSVVLKSQLEAMKATCQGEVAAALLLEGMGDGAVMTKPPVCGTSDWTEVRFDLVNRAGKDGSLMVDITDPNGTLPLAEQGVNIKNGQSISPIITMFRPTRTGKLAIKLVGSDWQGKNPIPVVNPGAWLDFEGTCTVSVDPVK